MLHFYGFGKLRLSYNGREADRFPTIQVEELLAFLILRPKIRHPRDTLIALLWPDVDEASARHRFSIVLSRLRKLIRALEIEFEDYFETNNQWVAFMPLRPYHFDCDTFNQLSRQAQSTSELAQKEILLKEALKLRCAPFMEGIYSDWILTEREYLNRIHLRILGQIMHCCTQRQAFDEAIEYGLNILQDDPLREDVHCALMSCYKAQNRPDLVIKQYQTCQALLKTELMLAPSAGTVALFQRLMMELAKYKLVNNSSSRIEKELLLAMDNFNRAANQLQLALQSGN